MKLDDIQNKAKRTFSGPIKVLMTEEQKQKANVQELSFDFACRITRLYKYLNEGNLSKADRDIIGAYGLQMLRSASSINANMNEALEPQSDSDFLSKTTISLKEARETNNWLNLFWANGYLMQDEYDSLHKDIDRIIAILVTLKSKVTLRLKREVEEKKSRRSKTKSDDIVF